MTCADADADRVDGRPLATILFVDEDAAIRQVAQRGLTRKGYRVLVADSAARALHILLLDHGRTDIVISNVMIPCVGGATRYLFTSAGAGGDALSVHLAKPWTIGELVEAISTLLAPAAPAMGQKNRTRR